MATLCGDLWKRALPDHDIFNKVRQNVHSEDRATSDRFSKNLIFCLNRDFFIWDEADSVFYTTHFGELNSEDGVNTVKYQTLLCTCPPLFEVHQVLLSPTQSHVALIGRRAATVLELPQRWGKKSQFEGGRDVIHCNSVPVAECLFAMCGSLALRQAAWYPGEPVEPHLVLLTSDNTIRCYSLKEPESPAKVLCVSQTEEDCWTHPRGRSYAASLGEIAVAFDFGCLVDTPHLPTSPCFRREVLVYPLYILYENGETYLSYMSLSCSGGNLGKVLGPLPMYPPARDNYGHDACAVLCLPCVPNILAIATETGLLYHCVVLEPEDEEEEDGGGGVVAKWMRRAEIVPTLYVFERMELDSFNCSPSDDEGFEESDTACSITLYADPLCQYRYHCVHEAGLHSVGLPWFHKLRKFLESGEEDKDGLRQLASEQRGIVERTLSTRPHSSRSSVPMPLRGFWIVSDFSLGACMICITSTYQCLLLPLLCAIRVASPGLLCSVPERRPKSSTLRGLAQDTLKHNIRSLLARNVAKPLPVRAGAMEEVLPPQDCLQTLSRATQVFREEYILKQDMASEEMHRRVKLLTAHKTKQQEDLALCDEEKKWLVEMAVRLEDKYQHASHRQEALISRVKGIVASQRGQLTVLSNRERDMRKELQVISRHLHHLSKTIKEVKMKTDYQEKTLTKGPCLSKSSAVLNSQQRRNAQGILKEQGGQIAHITKLLKDLKNHFSF
ncbi:nucleoporin 88 [Engraulis encrasicolus]|uniref:nucleoporin 88 n=1 Tax=Engraulis encrasicolus TaxID=184585 RepID=UPI002FD5A1D6